MSSGREKDIPIEVVKPMVPQKKEEKKEEVYVPEIQEMKVAGNKNTKHGLFDKHQDIPVVNIGRPSVDN